MKIHTFLKMLESQTGKAVKRSGPGYSARCPAHDDQNPSLSIKEEIDGKILLHCFAGCTVDSICDSLSIKIPDLFQPDFSAKPKQTIYSYTDEESRELYRKIRIEPGFDGRSKSFYLERVDETGQVVRSLQGCRRVLYRFPEVLRGIAENRTIYLVEGEKDADRLNSDGLIATTSLESLKWNEEFTEVLKEADVAILYDMDATGIQRRDLLCKNLYKKVKRLRVVNLPGLEYQESHGFDVTDWLARGHQITELLEITKRTADFIPVGKTTKIRAITMDEFLGMTLPKKEMILEPFFPSQGLCLLYAKRGVGKTHIALGIAYAVATGGTFLKWSAPRPMRVTYIDGEMPAWAMQERLRRIYLTEDLKPPCPSYLQLITPDLQEGPMPDLSTKEGREAIEELIKESDLIIIDNISTLFRSGIENEAESWQPVQDWALDLRRRGKAILFVHHAAKTGQQRGTSKREDILDVVINLKGFPGHSPEHGADFEVSFEKTRHFAGDDAAPFHVCLKEQDDDLWIWEIEDVKGDEEIEAVAAAIKEGLTIGQIIKRTQLTKSQVETRKKKAKEQGLI